ncbi:MAG: O-methyltransferase [Thiobacillaceae bacterium]
MFHDVPNQMLVRMQELEAIDARDRTDGTPRMQRLRQISGEVGRFIAILAASAPPGCWIEIGTSAGYSSLWLALACRVVGGTMTTYELSDQKAVLARQTFDAAGVDDVLRLVHGDALDHLAACKDIAFCFLDADKEIYGRCYEAVVPNMVKGGLLVADNVISHQVMLRPLLDQALQDQRVDGLIVPIGKGELVCRKL